MIQPAAPEQSPLGAWREQIIESAFRIFVVVCGATLVPALFLFREQGKLVSQGGIYVALFVTAVVLARRTASRARAVILSLTFAAAGVSAFLSHGFFSDARVVLVTASVFATVLVGARWGVALSFATVLLFFVGGLGLVHVPQLPPATGLSTAAVVTMQVLFVVFSAAGVIPIGSLLRRCGAALEEEREALERARAATRTAEEAVRELERGRGLLESFLENAPAMVHIKDREGRYELVNEAFAAASGKSAEYFRGKTMDDVLPAELAPMAERMRAADARVLATGTASETHELLPPSRRFLVTRFPIRSADGEIRGIGGIATDLTELEERARHTEESEARHRAIFEGIRHGVLIATAEGSIVDMNDGATRLFGVSRERLIGSSLALRSGEATFTRGDGVTFDAELRCAELPLHPGRRVLWIVRDVSAERALERKRHAEKAELEARVAARTRELLATNQELSAFSYSVSHDLRAPLRQVSGYVRLLQEHLERTGGAGDAALGAELAEVKEAAESMGRLIDGLLRAARSAESRRIDP